MNNTAKIVLAFVLGIALTFVGLTLVGNQSAASLGAGITANTITRYPNSGIAARFLRVSTVMPTSTQTDGSFQLGTGGLNSQVNVVGTASATVGQFVLGGISVGSATSSATSTITIPVAGLAVGDPCSAGLTTAPLTAFGIDPSITTSTANVATATVTFWNGVNSTITVATGTLRVKCDHLGI
jgi:hypothetical protein